MARAAAAVETSCGKRVIWDEMGNGKGGYAACQNTKDPPFICLTLSWNTSQSWLHSTLFWSDSAEYSGDVQSDRRLPQTPPPLLRNFMQPRNCHPSYARLSHSYISNRTTLNQSHASRPRLWMWSCRQVSSTPSWAMPGSRATHTQTK